MAQWYNFEVDNSDRPPSKWHHCVTLPPEKLQHCVHPCKTVRSVMSMKIVITWCWRALCILSHPFISPDHFDYRPRWWLGHQERCRVTQMHIALQNHVIVIMAVIVFEEVNMLLTYISVTDPHFSYWRPPTHPPPHTHPTLTPKQG